MRATRAHGFGEALRLDEVPAPEPGPGELRPRVHAAGLNFADTLMVAGSHQERREPPLTPGLEVCGTVEALGPGAEDFAEGDRVVCFAGGGGLAERACAPAARCVRAPAAMPDAVAAGPDRLWHVGGRAGPSRPAADGETPLVTGAASGVELGALMGARVIAVSSGAEELAVARAAGADQLIDGDADVRAEVKALGRADVIFETVGGGTFDAALRAARPEARGLPIGFAGGGVPRIPANLLLVKNLTVVGLCWGAYASLRPQVLTDSFARLLGWWEEGRLRPHVGHILPLEAANVGLDLLRRRRAAGKVVIAVGGSG